MSLDLRTAYAIDNLTKVYQNRQVLSIEQLDIHASEILAIVGPSGSGKSTLLRLLNFLEPPTAGRVTYRGAQFDPQHDVALDVRRTVTTVSQKPVLLNRSVRVNVEFGLRLRGRRDRDGEVCAALDKVGLAALERQDARTLSGGEAQRVALARAMVIRPDVLLLDEPTANLDPYNVAVIEDAVRKLNAEWGTTVVLVTHNVFQAHRLAHRVVFILDGKVIEVADAQTFFERPRDPRTAAFVRGEMVY